MNPRDQLAKEFLLAYCANPQYSATPTELMIAAAYEMADAFLVQIDLTCPTCKAKPNAQGNLLHISGCPSGWSEG